jgi:periplasmic divalent cation tolerance protein
VPTRDKFVVLVTCGSAGEAEQIARTLVEQRLAACVNLVETPVRSIYRWQDKIETASEYLLIIKTSRKKFLGLRRQVEQLHSYDVSEVIALPIVAGSPQYLRWLEGSLRRTRGVSKPRTKEHRLSRKQRDSMRPLDLLPSEKAKAMYA